MKSKTAPKEETVASILKEIHSLVRVLVQYPPPCLTSDAMLAAERFVESVVPRADTMNGPFPLWHGWVIREAFHAGMEWERTQREAKERVG